MRRGAGFALWVTQWKRKNSTPGRHREPCFRPFPLLPAMNLLVTQRLRTAPPPCCLSSCCLRCTVASTSARLGGGCVRAGVHIAFAPHHCCCSCSCSCAREHSNVHTRHRLATTTTYPLPSPSPARNRAYTATTTTPFPSPSPARASCDCASVSVCMCAMPEGLPSRRHIHTSTPISTKRQIERGRVRRHPPIHPPDDAHAPDAQNRTEGGLTKAYIRPSAIAVIAIAASPPTNT